MRAQSRPHRRRTRIGGDDVNGVSRRVGYQGEPGAYSQRAAEALEPGAALSPCRVLADVFGQVADGRLDAGVVPVENSLAGSIGETYDLLKTTSLTVTGETVIPIHHCLLAVPGTPLAGVRQAISHPQALAQCHEYLESLDVELIPFHDTAGAARHLAANPQPGLAAVAARGAAELYGLEVLAENIESGRENFTRFFRIERQPRPRGDRNKTVVVMSLPHHPGSLFMALASFACRSITLTRIESRPTRHSPWEYVFFLEFEGHVEDWPVKSALDELGAKTDLLRVLGSFALAEGV